MNADERLSRFSMMTINSLSPEQGPSDSDWTYFTKALRSLNSNELEQHVKGLVYEMLENPTGIMFLLLALPELDFNI
jgi:hypothetical protein